ncbi:hypothetical protein ASD88_09665 [Pelomonas sp. Root662]|nr:hypothetical protein ASC81_09665 [Pelomonas sp. Root405]KRA73831.1 hypothetical protein ASD88_09665 [Pelomonas sp. Root662]
MSGVTTASPVFVEPPPPAPAAAAAQLRLPPARGDELGPQGRRALIGGVVAAHLVGGWALMQIDAVRTAVIEAAPVLMVDMIAPAEAPKPAPPPPRPQPRSTAPAPAPLIAAAPTPSPAPPAFVVPAPEPVLPQPVVVAPAPPAPPAPVAQPLAQVIKQVAPSAVRYVKEPTLDFPLLAKRAREHGTVVLRITVDAHGRLKEAWVHKSSGFERIDQAALKDIRTARFVPQMEDGRPVEWQTLAPLAYDL